MITAVTPVELPVNVAEMRHQTGLSDCMYWITLPEDYGSTVRLVSVSDPVWSTLTCA